MKLRPHLLVRASAGSGKTYQLVRRLIGLLADAESPESILAVTFSRKAAGEFRSKLLKAAADAVTDADETRKLAGEIGHPDWQREDFLSLLASLVRDPDSLRLSTIDAFFLELVGLFCLELGLGAEVRLADESADDFETRDLLRAIFSASGENVRQALFHLVEEDRGGESVRSFQDVLEQWIANALSLFRSAPEEAVWGALPPGLNLPPVSPEEWKARFSRFESALQRQSIPPESEEGIQEMLDILREWDFSPTLPKDASKWMTAGAEDSAKLADGKKYFVINRKRVTLEAETGEALVALARVFHAHSVLLAVRNTRGAHAFLRMFEEEYAKRRLRTGSIRFADLPFLLSTLGEVEGSILAYRLDAVLKHWLLDEFQDTSRSQWQVIHPLVDELFFDAENNRSFYCVGDQKQAIYGWRQGDSRLFEEIYERYKDFEPRPIESRTLAKTYRCAPAIVEFTNGLFGSAASFPPDLCPKVVDRWMKTWAKHETARPEPVGLVEVNVATDDEARDQAVLDFLLDQRPWESGQSVALLCRKNKEANRFEAALRAAGVPTVRDGALALHKDFVTGRILHAIFQVVLHPGDTIALAVLQTCSARDAIRSFCGGEISARSLRRKWEERAASDFLAQLEGALQADGRIDESERRCLRRVFSLIHNIEASPEPCLREIVRTLRHARIEDTGAVGSVQVLTIHRSKGLEFDVVILPDLDARTTPGNFREFWAHEENGRVTAILESVKKEVRSAFPELEAWAAEVEQERAFEDLCVHYVAVTRAVSSLHLFLGARKGKSSTGIHRWIENAFEPDPAEGVAVRLGEPVESMPRPPSPAPPPEANPPQPGVIASPLSRRLVSPSDSDDTGRPSPFLPGRSRSLDLGRRVHEALARYEWPGNEFSNADCDPEVSEMIAGALESEAVRNLLSSPAGPTRVWHERAFDACIDGAWSSGVFDRVHLPEGGREGPASPTIIDFKTDRSPADEIPASHKHQMSLYRKALAMILGIEEIRIRTILVYLRSGTVVEVP